MSNGITVLTDSIGLQREYTEVKRRARVGERIKVTATNRYNMRDMTIANIYTVVKTEDGDVPIITDDVGDDAQPSEKNYVVLEPTDIIRIDDVQGTGSTSYGRFRLVERKARVGERIIYVHNGNSDNIAVMVTAVNDRVADVYYTDSDGDEVHGIRHGYYRILEPLSYEIRCPDGRRSTHTPDSQMTTPLSAKSAEEQYAENIAVLTRRVTELETMNRANIGKITQLERTVSALDATVNDPIGAPPSDTDYSAFGNVKTVRVESQPTRDEVVERAKADVAKISADIAEGSTWDSKYPLVEKYGHQQVGYVINHEKRTVVALVRNKYYDIGINAKGIARCAPDDVFNSAIGRAIVLRRALGLEVPREYTHAPKPTEVRVGDIVGTFLDSGKFHERFTVTRVEYVQGNTHLYNDILPGFCPFEPDYGDRVIDDSREETEADV
jgi:hypothetical protein